MAALGPFERRPRLAVAVSGGSDSMALLLLSQEWAADRKGAVTALTVDHGLRPEAAAEARQVARWCKSRGIAHRTLVWRGKKPGGDIQAAARAARYGLLEAWCAEAGVLHLLLAHHLDDQAETFLLRLARGSGLDGLAAIAPVVERPDCRLLRPLLGWNRARLAATLAARGQAWLDDPSNNSDRYARVRLRKIAPVLAGEGLTPARLAATARRLARARQALELPLAQLLARAVTPDPAGFVRLDAGQLSAAPEELGLRALAALLAAVGGADYPPRLERLERLYRLVVTGELGSGRTLGGCRIVPHRGALLVCREAKGMAPPVAALPGTKVNWDGRFSLRLAPNAPKGRFLAAAGPIKVNGAARDVPACARIGAAALRDSRGIVAAPGLGYARRGGQTGGTPLLRASRPATGGGVKVV